MVFSDYSLNSLGALDLFRLLTVFYKNLSFSPSVLSMSLCETAFGRIVNIR